MGCKRKEITGNRYGKLVAIKFIEDTPVEHIGKWECYCDCGNTHYVKYNTLAKGKTKSCGLCPKKSRVTDIVGNKYNSLTVLAASSLKPTSKTIEAMWLCRCDCGKELLVRGGALKNGHTKSCGCLKKAKCRTPEHIMYIRIKTISKQFNIPFNLELSDIVIPSHCRFTGLKLVKGIGNQHNASPSIDKIIPELGYVKGNICVISLKANMLKSYNTRETLQAYIDYINEFHPNT